MKRPPTAHRPIERTAIRHQLRVLAAAAIAWTIAGVLVLLFLGERSLPGTDPRSWPSLLQPTVVFVALWAMWTPPLLGASGRLAFVRPAWRLRNVWVAILLGMLAVSAAFLHLLAFAAVVTALTDAGTLTSLSDGTLLFIGRLREDIAIATLLVSGQHLLRQREDARRRELDAARVAAALSESRLQALSMELQPHFLFNTLNAIAGMVWQDPAKADAMIVQLSELLRRTLEAGKSPTSTLAEERHVLGLYLAIQAVRFGPRLTVTFDVPESLQSVVVPSFLLQPIVENAFQHGFAGKAGAVSLIVRVEHRGDRLVVTVLDDGVGIDTHATPREGTGIGNMRRRLTALYGDAGELSVSPRNGGGAVVRVSFPVQFVVPADRSTHARVGPAQNDTPTRELAHAHPDRG